MGTEQVVGLFRHTLEMALLMGAPLLLIAVTVSLLVNVAQVLTSLQDQTLSTVPRLAVMALAIGGGPPNRNFSRRASAPEK